MRITLPSHLKASIIKTPSLKCPNIEFQSSTSLNVGKLTQTYQGTPGQMLLMIYQNFCTFLY